jgi:hypothetical protein
VSGRRNRRHRHLHTGHERHRESELPVPASRPAPRALPDRAVGDGKILYLAVRERRPNRSHPTGKINGWKSILNTLAITYGDRLNIN